MEKKYDVYEVEIQRTYTITRRVAIPHGKSEYDVSDYFDTDDIDDSDFNSYDADYEDDYNVRDMIHEDIDYDNVCDVDTLNDVDDIDEDDFE